MALVIETGAGVEGANSYASVQEAKDYAEARGLTLPATDPEIEALLIKACDFLDSLESRYKGSRVSPDQALAWPRSDVFLYNSEETFSETEIPTALLKAQCQLAFDGSLTDLQPTGNGREVLKEKVDVIETTYAERKSGSIEPEFNKAMGILEPLFKTAGGFSLTSLRV